MGGEKDRIDTDFGKGIGSPPHGRGKADYIPAGWFSAGITPAWAGKSPQCKREKPAPQDHPRMGGEKFGAVVRHCRVLGSPPHGRGKVR